jgi:hypothetical protein
MAVYAVGSSSFEGGYVGIDPVVKLIRGKDVVWPPGVCTPFPRAESGVPIKTSAGKIYHNIQPYWLIPLGDNKAGVLVEDGGTWAPSYYSFDLGDVNSVKKLTLSAPAGIQTKFIPEVGPNGMILIATNYASWAGANFGKIRFYYSLDKGNSWTQFLTPVLPQGSQNATQYAGFKGSIVGQGWSLGNHHGMTCVVNDANTFDIDVYFSGNGSTGTNTYNSSFAKFNIKTQTWTVIDDFAGGLGMQFPAGYGGISDNVGRAGDYIVYTKLRYGACSITTRLYNTTTNTLEGLTVPTINVLGAGNNHSHRLYEGLDGGLYLLTIDGSNRNVIYTFNTSTKQWDGPYLIPGSNAGAAITQGKGPSFTMLVDENSYFYFYTIVPASNSDAYGTLYMRSGSAGDGFSSLTQIDTREINGIAAEFDPATKRQLVVGRDRVSGDPAFISYYNPDSPTGDVLCSPVVDNTLVIHSSSLKNTNNLFQITLPGLQTVGNNAFEGSAINNTNGISTAKSIGAEVFLDGNLSSLYLPDATSIGDRAFYSGSSVFAQPSSVYINSCTSLGSTTGYDEVFGGWVLSGDYAVNPPNRSSRMYTALTLAEGDINHLYNLGYQIS